MPRVKLTKRLLDSVKAEGSDLVFWDTERVRLGVRVKPYGVKSHVASSTVMLKAEAGAFP